MFAKKLARQVVCQRRCFGEVAKHIDSKRATAVAFEDSNWQNVHWSKMDRPGDTESVNWALAKLQINPQYEAFRNAPLEHLVERSYGTADTSASTKNNSHVVVKADAYKTDAFDHFVTLKQSSAALWPQQAADWEVKYHRRTHKELSYYLTHVPSSFVHDGDVGSHVTSNASLPVVTDNAVSALFLRNIMLPIKLGDAFKYNYDSYVLHAPGFRFTPQRIVEEFGGPQLSDLGVHREQFVSINEAAGNALISGVSDTATLFDAMAFLAARNIAAKSDNKALLLSSDALVDEQTGSVTLLLNSTPTVTSALFSNNNNNITLYGAHHNVWSESGLSRAWGGVSLLFDEQKQADLAAKASASAPTGALVERLAATQQLRITRKSSVPVPNLVKHPKSVVLLVNDASQALPALSRTSAATGARLYTAGLVGVDAQQQQAQFRPALFSSTFPSPVNAKALGAQLEALLGSSGADVFVVNTAQPSAAVDSALRLVASGQAAAIKPSASSGPFAALQHESFGKAGSSVGDLSKVMAQLDAKLGSLPEAPKPAEPAAEPAAAATATPAK